MLSWRVTNIPCLLVGVAPTLWYTVAIITTLFGKSIHTVITPVLDLSTAL